MNNQRSQPGFGEFVALMAMMMSLVALSIDAILPALPDIGRDLGVVRANDTQLVISLLFLGFAAGQLIYGPLSDAAGRKPTVYLGFGMIAVGSILSLTGTSFPMMLAGRFLQGVGVAGPRTVTLALVRDRYEGRTMARVMSFVMGIFILAPVVAPALGQGVLLFAGWRAIFGFYLGLVVVVSIWFGIRQPETLAPDRRIPFTAARIAAAAREVLFNRVAFGYTIAQDSSSDRLSATSTLRNRSSSNCTVWADCSHSILESAHFRLMRIVCECRTRDEARDAIAGCACSAIGVRALGGFLRPRLRFGGPASLMAVHDLPVARFLQRGHSLREPERACDATGRSRRRNRSRDHWFSRHFYFDHPRNRGRTSLQRDDPAFSRRICRLQHRFAPRRALDRT